jgi:hypothetical protein
VIVAFGNIILKQHCAPCRNFASKRRVRRTSHVSTEIAVGRVGCVHDTQRNGRCENPRDELVDDSDGHGAVGDKLWQVPVGVDVNVGEMLTEPEFNHDFTIERYTNYDNDRNYGVRMSQPQIQTSNMMRAFIYDSVRCEMYVTHLEWATRSTKNKNVYTLSENGANQNYILETKQIE